MKTRRAISENLCYAVCVICFGITHGEHRQHRLRHTDKNEVVCENLFDLCVFCGYLTAKPSQCDPLNDSVNAAWKQSHKGNQEQPCQHHPAYREGHIHHFMATASSLLAGEVHGHDDLEVVINGNG